MKTVIEVTVDWGEDKDQLAAIKRMELADIELGLEHDIGFKAVKFCKAIGKTAAEEYGLRSQWDVEVSTIKGKQDD